MKNSNVSISRMARIIRQLPARACVGAVFQKSPQKLYNREPLQSNQQLGVRNRTVFHTETVQIHTESVQQ